MWCSLFRSSLWPEDESQPFSSSFLAAPAAHPAGGARGPLPPDALSALQPGAPVCPPGAGASSGTGTSLPGAPRLGWALAQSHRRCSAVSRGTLRNGPEEGASRAWERGSDATGGLQGDSRLLPPPSWWDCDWGASPSSLLQRPQTEGMSSDHLTRGSQWACTCFWLC